MSPTVSLADIEAARDRLADANLTVVVSSGTVNRTDTDHAGLTCIGLFELGRHAETRLALESWPAKIGGSSNAPSGRSGSATKPHYSPVTENRGESLAL